MSNRLHLPSRLCTATIYGAYAIAAAVLLYGLPSLSACAAPVEDKGQSKNQTAAQLAEQLDEAKAAVQLKPDDAHLHYSYGELLRKSGKYRQAACEYLDAVDLDPTMYVAFHQIARINCDPSQLDEAFTYLSELDEDHPNDLMLKIALSELLERKDEYYKAARTLIDISYADKLPPKLAPRVKARIHYLLAKARQEQKEGKDFAGVPTNAPMMATDDESGGLPPPLPENMRTQPLNLTNSAKTTEGTGHSTLLP